MHDWIPRARELQNEPHNYSLRRIARELNISSHAVVKYALDPEYRERHREHNRKKHTKKTPEKLHRDRMLKYAKEEALEQGKSVNEILIGWGEPPLWKGKQHTRIEG